MEPRRMGRAQQRSMIDSILIVCLRARPVYPSRANTLVGVVDIRHRFVT